MFKRPTFMNFDTKIIKKRQDFEDLFFGFKRLKAVCYIASPEIIFDFFDNGYEYVELVIGNNLVDKYKENSSPDKIDCIDKLLKLTEEKKLNIWGSPRPLHTKLFLLENDSTIRFIQTSANFTETAKQAFQINYCWIFEAHKPQMSQSESDFIKKVSKDYDIHRKYGTKYLADLIEMMNKGTSKEDSIKYWLCSYISDKKNETNKMLGELAEQAFGFDEESRSTISLTLESPLSKGNSLNKILLPFNAKLGNNSISLVKSTYLDHKKHLIPLMRINPKTNELLLGIAWKVKVRSKPFSATDNTLLNDALDNVERFINGVDFGTSPNKHITKTNMYEALIYMFTTPFFNEYMKKKRSCIGHIDDRGPRMLYIHGRSFNGKSLFLKYALKLICGDFIHPLSGKEFNKRNTDNITVFGTCFPLVFDDVPNSKFSSSGVIENVVKNYWENLWQSDWIFPQIVISANYENPPEWAKTRFKSIEFNVLYKDDSLTKKHLNSLIEEDNDIFCWFAFQYLERIHDVNAESDDELMLSRKVLIDLYEKAQRKLPSYFPTKPIESLYDVGHQKWIELIKQLKKATIKKHSKQCYIQFDKDMTNLDISTYLKQLPQYIMYSKKGSLVIIENTEDFIKWINLFEGQPLMRILNRFFGNL